MHANNPKDLESISPWTGSQFPGHRGDSSVSACLCRSAHCQRRETKALPPPPPKILHIRNFHNNKVPAVQFLRELPEWIEHSGVSHLLKSHRVTDDRADRWWARPLTPPLTTGSPSLATPTYHLVPVSRQQTDSPPSPASPSDPLPPPLLLQPAPFFPPSFLFFFYCVLHNLLLPQRCALVFLLRSCDLLYDCGVHLSRWIQRGPTYTFIHCFFHSKTLVELLPAVIKAPSFEGYGHVGIEF